MKVIDYRQALNEALHEEMARDERVIVLGEDIGRDWEGAFLAGAAASWLAPHRLAQRLVVGAAVVGLCLATLVYQFPRPFLLLVPTPQGLTDYERAFRGMGTGAEAFLGPWTEDVPTTPVILPDGSRQALAVPSAGVTAQVIGSTTKSLSLRVAAAAGRTA